MRSYIAAFTVAVALGRASAFAPIAARRVRVSMSASSRREVAFGAAAGLLGLAAPVFAEEAAVAPAPAAVELGPAPTDWGLTNDYYKDAPRVVAHMRYATNMPKGTPNYENIAKNCKKEMIDFCSFYRRFPNIAGKPSFSTMYTAINVLAGHYTNYGVKFPVPEKRKKRLMQEYAEIEKNLKRNR